MAETAKKKRKVKVSKVVNGVDTIVEVEVDDEGGPSWGPNEKHTLINKRLNRVDGPVKVSGAAVYTYDVRLPGMLYARILRSPHAHARIARMNTTAAKRISGVRAVVATSDIIRDLASQPSPASQAPQTKEDPQEVRYEGAPVAAVAATSPEAAEDAIHAITVEYEVMPHVIRPEVAIAPNAPKIFKDGNLEEVEKNGDPDKVAKAFSECAAVVETEYRTPVVHHCCLETHGVVVDFRGARSATTYASTQHTSSVLADTARELGVPESNVTAIVQHMGGGFGSKFGLGMEGRLASRLSRMAKAPVKLMLTRHDEFVMAGNRSASWQKVKLGARKDGSLVAMQSEQYRMGGVGQGSQRGQPYIYSVENVYRRVSMLHTNVNSSRAMRAPGHPQASFAMESVLDELADKLGMDPLDLRKKNLKDAAYHRQLDRGAKEIGWSRRNRLPGSGAGPRKRGIGCAVGTWGGFGRPGNVVTVNISRDGAVHVAVGTQDLGTGTRTYTRAIVAEELGLQVRQVVEEIGNSKFGAATGSGGSTTAASLAPAVKEAAYNARLKMAEAVAPMIGVKVEEISFAAGELKGGGKSLSWKQACQALPPAGLSARGEWKPGLSDGGVHGASFAEVEVDVETGHVQPIKIVHVQDMGLPLNRLAAESQINGGVIQAIGMALWEGRVTDDELGVMLNPGFGDYKIPGCLEIPEIVPIIDDGDTREAVIGMAEPAHIPTIGALANAVFNASGVRVRELPITPDKILIGLQGKGKTA